MTTMGERPDEDLPASTAEADPGEPMDDSVLADVPDTTTGKEHLLQNDEGTPGPGV